MNKTRRKEKMSLDLSQSFANYKPRFNILTETNSYILKTAQNLEELSSLLKLRYDNFLAHTEHGKGVGGIDTDDFDSQCDHIIIYHKETKSICGTYRVLFTPFNQHFYSQQEFDISRFLSSPGNKMELGRACVRKEFRNTAVIDLLWKGIAHYIELTGANYLFGCSSIATVNPSLTKALSYYFKKNDFESEQYNVMTLPKYNFDLKDVPLPDMEQEDIKKNIPPLLRSYLTAGAKIHGPAALDRDFECIDYLTIINMEKLAPLYRKRYFRH